MEIELVSPNNFNPTPNYPMQLALSPTLRKSITSQTKTQSRRQRQHLLWFWMVVICQLVTSYAIVLLRVIPSKNTTYLIYCNFTIVRALIWFINSYLLTGCTKSLFYLYMLPDANLLYYFCSFITYITLNYKNSGALAIWAIVMYPILVFFMVGNFRVMMMYCEWQKWQICFYKFVRFNAAVFYLGYGVYSTIDSQIDNIEQYLLFIFTTFGLYAEMLATFNRMDTSDILIPTISIKTDQHENLVGKYDQFDKGTWKF